MGIRCHHGLLRDSVLANLLTNTLKFSPRGSAVTLSARREGDRAVLEVADRGPGLPSGIVELLDKGRRLESLRGTEGETGSGLGLLQACDYVQLMGGRVRFEDRKGGGTRVVLSLPAC